MKVMVYNDANKVADKLFESFNSGYQGNLKISMERSEFIFDSVQLMYYIHLKLNFRRGGSYIDSPDWIKKEKSNNKSEK